ncbi:MAG: hypothetical protein AABY07_00340 [Nanoarchaeota archaeon]|mgnify:CR=1 FL=1
MINKPNIEPWFPEDLTVVEDLELGKLLTLYTLWKNYSAYQVALVEGNLLKLKERLKIEKAKELIKLNNSDLKDIYKAKEDREAYVLQLDHIASLSIEVANFTAEFKLEESVNGIFNDRYTVTSREISRRVANWGN